ncbi:MAG: family 43 glycosylhydrolase [Phycisphaerales bacterium]|nr:family 43 glycosylhydrolase [Phycisphaerales bacterium]
MLNKTIPCALIASFLSGLVGCATRPASRSTITLHPRTFCNPMNLDYAYTPIPGAYEKAPHRATADPVIVRYHGDYYLFSTNQWGYWWSPDLVTWNFVTRRFLKPQHKVFDELCAPAAWVMNDALCVIGSTYTTDFPIWTSRNPKVNDWSELIPGCELAAWDPAFFVEDDGRVYAYWGSNNRKPLFGVEVDRHTMRPIGEPREMIGLHPDIHGWERFGEANDNTWLRPFIEGAWMNKHNGRYYLQYGAPGTEFSGYGDGVYVGDKPLGPFTYQAHNPFSYKTGGFARGAGHGSSFEGNNGDWWHVATIAIGVKDNFERRIGLWPAGFDADGVMYCDTAYGDFPLYAPPADGKRSGSRRPGWMILNYARPARASSTLGGHTPNFAVNEDIKTYWSAKTSRAGEWFESDLGARQRVCAIQINYADQDATFIGKASGPGICHQYRLLASLDGEHWDVIVDKSASVADTPHDYVELTEPIDARFVRIENVHVPTGKFALSGLRVFGTGYGDPPPAVEGFSAFRGVSEPRNAWLKWQTVNAATGYVIYAGVDASKLYTSVMVLGANDYYFRALDRDKPHYFQIEAFNENGVSSRSDIVKAGPADTD